MERRREKGLIESASLCLSVKESCSGSLFLVRDQSKLLLSCYQWSRHGRTTIGQAFFALDRFARLQSRTPLEAATMLLNPFFSFHELSTSEFISLISNKKEAKKKKIDVDVEKNIEDCAQRSSLLSFLQNSS